MEKERKGRESETKKWVKGNEIERENKGTKEEKR